MRLQGHNLVKLFEGFLADEGILSQFKTNCQLYGGWSYEEYKCTFDQRRYDLICNAFNFDKTGNRDKWQIASFKWNQLLRKIEDKN